MTSTTPAQRDQAWLSAATPEQVAAAFAAGELAELLGGRPPRRPEPGAQLTAEQLAGMTAQEIASAFEAGACDALLGRSGAEQPPAGG